MLQLQEFGGVATDRENIPTSKSRVSGSQKRLVSKRYYLNRVKPKNRKPIKDSKRFMMEAKKAGRGSTLLYGNALVYIRRLKKNFVHYTRIYAHEQNRSIRLRKRPFISVAGENASREIPKLYSKNAYNRIKKYAGK